MRDNFSLKIKETMVRRVGMLCSNPGCRKLKLAALLGITALPRIQAETERVGARNARNERRPAS